MMPPAQSVFFRRTAEFFLTLSLSYTDWNGERSERVEKSAVIWESLKSTALFCAVAATSTVTHRDVLHNRLSYF